MPSFLRSNLSDRGILDDNILLTLDDLENEKNVDILFLGSSHAYRTFDPRIWERYGYNTFNLGTSAQTHIHTGLLLNTYLEKLAPTLVVYEVYPDIFANNGVEANSIFLSYNICFDQMAEVMVQSKSVKSFNEYIYATYRNFVYSEDTYEISVDNNKQQYRGKGFVERKTNDFKEVESFTRGAILQKQIDAFRSNIRKLQEANILFVLVRAPVTKVEIDRFPDIDIYDELMKDYDNFYDLSQMKELEDSIHFYDFHHLNQSGVEVFNPLFIDTLFHSVLTRK